MEKGMRRGCWKKPSFPLRQKLRKLIPGIRRFLLGSQPLKRVLPEGLTRIVVLLPLGHHKIILHLEQRWSIRRQHSITNQNLKGQLHKSNYLEHRQSLHNKSPLRGPPPAARHLRKNNRLLWDQEEKVSNFKTTLLPANLQRKVAEPVA